MLVIISTVIFLTILFIIVLSSVETKNHVDEIDSLFPHTHEDKEWKK